MVESDFQGEGSWEKLASFTNIFINLICKIKRAFVMSFMPLNLVDY